MTAESRIRAEVLNALSDTPMEFSEVTRRVRWVLPHTSHGEVQRALVAMQADEGIRTGSVEGGWVKVVEPDPETSYLATWHAAFEVIALTLAAEGNMGDLFAWQYADYALAHGLAPVDVQQWAGEATADWEAKHPGLSALTGQPDQ